jgi:ABC-type transport system involved in multi-copper enzyme maturation permease subunit
MFWTLYRKEIQLSLRSTRFVIALAIIMAAFALSGVVGSASYHNQLGEYRQRDTEATRKLMDQMGNLSSVALYPLPALLPPSPYPYIRDLSSTRLPERIVVNAVHHLEMEKAMRSNPLLSAAESFSWEFILAMAGGFIAILLSYDSIAEERRQGTISLIFSNPLTRWRVITAKLLALVTINAALVAAGMLISMLILAFTDVPVLAGDAPATVVIFFILSVLYLAFVTALGIFISSLTRTPSLALTALFFIWVALSLILPSAARVTASSLERILTADERERESDQVVGEIMDENNRTRPEVNGSTIVNYSRIPFTAVETHVANGYVKVYEALRRLQGQYEERLFDQGDFGLELARWSPVELFRESSAKLTGSDIERWRRFLNEVENYRKELGAAIKALDGRDSASPHVYFVEDLNIWLSQRPVEDSAQIPRFGFKEPELAQRIGEALQPAAWLVLWTFVITLLAVIVFLRADVRQQHVGS